MRFVTLGSFGSLVVSVGLFFGCSNGSGDSGGSGGGGGTGATTQGASGEAGNAPSSGGSGGSTATGGGAGEAGALEAGAGNVSTGGGSGTGGESTGGTGGGDTGGTGGTGGSSTGGTGGTGGSSTGGTGGDTGGSGGTGGKGTTPSPNVGCMGSVTSDQSHELTSCGLSVSKIAGTGQTQFTLGIQGKDSNDDGLTLTLQFTDVPTATTYTFTSSDYMQFSSTWNEGSTIYTATAYDGIAGIGDLTVEFDTIDGPFTLASTTFYTVTGSISGTLENPPSGMATLDLKF